MLQDLKRSIKVSSTATHIRDADELVEETGSLGAAEPVLLQSPDVESLRHQLEGQAAEMKRVVAMLGSKFDGCAELAGQNQLLHKELIEVKCNYEFVSGVYDAQVAQAGATQSKNERRRQTASPKSQILAIYPALGEADEWLHSHPNSIPIKQCLEVPVLCLR